MVGEVAGMGSNSLIQLDVLHAARPGPSILRMIFVLEQEFLLA